MTKNLIAILFLLLIWLLNGKSILKGIQKKKTGEIYHHLAMGLFFTIPIIESFFGISGISFQFFWLKIIGYILFIPSAVFIFGAFYQLKKHGKADSLEPGSTIKLVDSGVFSIVRHPMWVGFSLWSFAFILCFQSLVSLVIGMVVIILFRISSIKDDKEGINCFGDAYREYMKKTPF